MAFTLSIGALSDPLKEQPKDFNLDKDEIEHWQKDVDACNRLRIRGLLPRSVAIKTEQKLVNRIVKSVQMSQK